MSLTSSAQAARSSHAIGAQAGARTANGDPYKWLAIAMIAAFALTLPTIVTLIVMMQPTPPAPAWTAEATSLGVTREDILEGEEIYLGSCAVCHGRAGEGIPRIGKPLRNSAYVQEHSDEELFQLIVEGRNPSDPANSTGAVMPPRGQQGLPDESIRSVITYLRAIQDPDEPVVSVAAWDLGGEAGEGAGAAAAAVELTDHPGYELFISSCAACHGQGGEGIENQGLPLTSSGFVRSKSDKDLITFIKMGRPMWDENNATGLDMPPKGGNPAITDEDLQTIVAYIRALQEEATGS